MQRQEKRRKRRSAAQGVKIGAFGLVCLAVILFLVGCNIRQFFRGESSEQPQDKFWAGVRPVSEETERLLRNFRFLKMSGRTHLAMKELEEAHQRDPDNAKIVDILAQCYEELGAWDQAEKLYLKALARDRDNQALANNLCFSYYQAGKFDKAEACFRDLLKRQPQNATVRNNLGLLLTKMGRQEEAYRMWREGEGEATARTRLNQALAALGLAPQPKIARQFESDKAIGKVAAAPPPKTAGTPPIPEKVKAAAAPAPMSQKEPSSETRPARAALRPEKLTAVPAETQKPAKPVAHTAPREPEIVQVKAPAAPSATAATTPGKTSVGSSPASNSASHLARSSVLAVSETQTTVDRPASPGPAVEPAGLAQPTVAGSPSAAPKAQSSVNPGKGAAPPLMSPKPPAPAAPPAPSPRKSQVKIAAPANPKQTPKAPAASAPIEPKRPDFLTTRELVDTRLEIKNGNGVKGIAALNRTWLTMEGFHVAAIGNHIDFGQKNTLIAYQPDAERVARVLKEDFFPQADLKPSSKLGKDADVRITLGHDQKSRKSQIEERIALLDLRAQLAVILASSRKSEAGLPVVAAAPTGSDAPPAQAPRTAPASPPAPAAVSTPVTDQAVNLSAVELMKTKIELRNGNGVQDQARKLRSEMEVQGFTVVRIKNHIDFGMEQTRILYRSGSGRVAQALGQKYFRTGRLEETAKLPENVDVKVILGKDLAGGPDLMAQLVR